ncbi:MAG: hypothetical protein AABX89_02990 [Candidatus Thermoplasmatota archaeon]
MRWTLLTALLLTGCVAAPFEPTFAGNDSAPEPGSFLLDPIEEGVFSVDTEGRLERLTSGSGVTVEAGRVTIDLLSNMGENSIPLILVQSLTAGRYTYKAAKQLEFAGGSGEGNPNRGDCVTNAHLTAQGAHFYVDRLRGLDPAPPRWMSGGGGMSAGTSFPALPVDGDGGGAGGSGSGSGTLDAGDWFVSMRGSSQVTVAELLAPGNVWTLTYELPGASRILLLPPAQLYCYWGFTELDGVQVDAADTATGGSMRLDGTYGSTVTLHEAPSTSLGCLTPLVTGGYDGRLTVGERNWDLDGLTRVSNATIERLAVELTITSWPCQSVQVFWGAGVYSPFSFA